MLLQLTAKHRGSAAQAMISAVLAMWLSVFCQQCMAYSHLAPELPDASTHSAHCLTPPADDVRSLVAKTSCLTPCHCSVMLETPDHTVAGLFLSPSASDGSAAVPPSPVQTGFTAPRRTAAIPASCSGHPVPILERFCIHLE